MVLLLGSMNIRLIRHFYCCCQLTLFYINSLLFIASFYFIYTTMGIPSSYYIYFDAASCCHFIPLSTILLHLLLLSIVFFFFDYFTPSSFLLNFFLFWYLVGVGFYIAVNVTLAIINWCDPVFFFWLLWTTSLLVSLLSLVGGSYLLFCSQLPSRCH